MNNHNNNNKKKVLGRGLAALLESPQTDITARNQAPAVVGSTSEIPISMIEANPFQPRTHFEEIALKELCDSIKQLGVIQPVTVRKMGYDKYQLISGERRFRASQLAGLTQIPAFVRVANDQSMLEMAIVENIQRENLDPIEVALSFKRLIEECKLSQEELSEKVGKQRSTVANFLRLLKLPAAIQAGIREKKITMGHAKTLINIEDEGIQVSIFEQILADDLSVRAVEELVRALKNGIPILKTNSDTAQKKDRPDPIQLSFEQQKIINDLKAHLQSEINLKKTVAGKGNIIITFNSEEDLDRILKVLDF